MSDVRAQIDELVKNNKVVLFMKGTKMFPQCGFSARSVEIFKRCGVSFKDVNVLADPAIRQGVKDYSQWPTVPQVYIDGKFVGGSDILQEMFDSGDLHKALGMQDEGPAPTKPPELKLTAAAAAAFSDALKDAEDQVLRFEVPPSFQYDLYIGNAREGDLVVETGGLAVHVAPRDAARVEGTTIDFVDGPDGAGFRIDNPQEPPRVRPMAPRALKALLDEKKKVHVMDARSSEERQLASIAGALPLDEAQQTLADLAKDALIVVYCHHGVRSKSAGQMLVDQGFRNVHNLTGGIDAWSATIDSSVPRY